MSNEFDSPNIPVSVEAASDALFPRVIGKVHPSDSDIRAFRSDMEKQVRIESLAPQTLIALKRSVSMWERRKELSGLTQSEEALLVALLVLIRKVDGE